VRRIILLLLIACARLHAQNIEGQIVASQFGQFQVPGTGDESLEFSPASCQVSGGGKNFSAFEVGVPVKIVDTNPALTEIDTPTNVFLNACSVAMTTTYPHSTPFYLTSGTGGLQEALTNGIETGGGPTTVILNADWYTQVKPANPATVLASVKGSTSLGLVDVTTTPYTYYQWNGTNYAAIANAGGATLPSTGIVFANNTSTGATATSPQIVAGLNATPSTLLSPSLLPLGTGSQVGAVKSDGTTTSISGSGVISAIPPTGAANLIVATPNGSSGTAAPRAMVAADMPAATSSAFGAVKPDNTTITISGGVISSVGGGGGAPGGSPTNVQFYGASTFAGDSTFTFNNSSHTLAFQNGTSSATAPAGDNSTKIPNTAAVFSSMPGLPAQYFGAKGDAYAPPDGCSTTVSSNVVTCADGPFLAGDVGKQMWVQGGGAAGVAFHGTITAVTSTTTVTTSATASTAVTGGFGVYGTDDVTAVQACFQYSASNAVQCVLRAAPSPTAGGSGVTGFLIGSGGLQLVSNNVLEENSGESVVGSSSVKGTNLFCEFNGDCLTIAPGGIQGVTMSRLEFLMDPTQPASRAWHFQPTDGIFTGGELTTSTFNDIEIDNPALECLWMDGGGGPGYTFNKPNQILNFFMFQCNGPNQSHPAALIKMTGQAAQILFENGQVNGLGVANYPNYLIDIEQGQVGWNVAPVDVKFFGYTIEVGQKGLYAGDDSNNIHFDNGYVEDITNTVFTLQNSPGFTFNGNHIASSAYAGGAVGIGQLLGGSTASIRDNWVYGNTPAALAVCSGSNNSIDFAGDVVQAEPTNLLTTNCATATASTTGGALTIGQGATTASISCSGAAISALAAPGVQPGKTLTMYAPSSGCQFTTGGNIAFGNYSAPLTIPAGGTVTMTLLDSGVTFLVTDAPAPTSFSLLTAGSNTDTGAFSTNGPWTFHNNVYIGSGSPSTFSNNGAIAPSAYDQFTTNQIGGTCSMSAGTTCTITIGNNYAAPVCIATEQGTSATVIAAACSVSGTTVTITAASPNSATWGAFVFGNSH
jgi:hypothetical protein